MTTRRSITQENLPEGTVSFVFTDVEGSTQGVMELGDATWAELLAEHDRLLRRAFEAEGGRVVNTEGDALFVVFPVAADAVRGAVAAQRALTDHDWEHGTELRVRMGVHTGAALVRDGDYVGAEVHRAARISDTGHGGQIIVSEATAALARDSLPDSVELVDLGAHRLKDLTAPQQLFGLRGDGLPSDFPPLRTLDAFPNNLPVQRSSLIGRADEIANARKLLESNRLVTLTGIGGTGKTRLALQVASEQLEAHPDGVFFVDLAPVADTDVVAHTAAQAVGLQLGGPRPPQQQLLEWLRHRRCMLVLDNCEHLLDACADLVDGVLDNAPEVVVLATSREPLEVEGEHVYRVPSLRLPAPDSDPATIVGSEAARLFVERARSVDAGFELTGDDVAAVAQIIRRLDGIPLAIEFAAARVSHLSPGDIAERLEGRFRLLTGGRRRVRRQQTLEATLDWSFELLDDAQQQLLRRLGVFPASFDLSMAERACAGGAVSEHAVLDLLGALVDKSLVLTETSVGHVRYRLLETVRSYAEQKLQDAGEAEQYRGQHRDAYLAWLESRPWEDQYIEGAVWEAIVAEHENLRAALHWSQGDGRRDLVGRIAARAHPLWQPYEGHGAEGARWLDWALEEPDALAQDVRAACLLARSSAAMTNGETFEPYAMEAVATASDELGGPLVFAYGMLGLGAAVRAVATRDPSAGDEARVAADEGLRLARDLGDDWIAISSMFHGQVAGVLGDLTAAERSLATAVDGRMAPCLHDGAAAELSTFRAVLGDAPGALEAASRGRLEWRSISRPFAYVQAAAALAAAQNGRLVEAADRLEAAMSMVDSMGVFLERNATMTFAAAMSLELGEASAACRLLEAAVTVGDAQETDIPFRSPGVTALYAHGCERARAALGHDDVHACRQQGRSWAPEEAWAAVRAVEAALRSTQPH